MPKQGPAHQTEHERRAAARIRAERESRGWSVDRMAERLRQVGHPIGRTAIYKIESGARRLSVDELMGFAIALGHDVGKLVMPLDAEVMKLLREHRDVSGRQAALQARLVEIENRLLDIVDEGDRELVHKLLGSPIGDVEEDFWRIRTGRQTQELRDRLSRVRSGADGSTYWVEDDVEDGER
ncbi:helix-turn-helix domain-containing protein [Nocardioides okcheonensis]|uniref:helix-turn-helix domain-containing protein n=1 Tax=Nocardioides okcheonensis TaxID=2894081 RepID=UPI001E5E929B|nr:helix-turn-helix transcriptional regulator [Nocardioides okcheonensis]UFN44522.1 helix-turn-helix domain-containing protein [Nocardioides okcheonensis]